MVFSIERFLSKASPEYRLPGFYVVDAITRAASKAPGDSEQAAYLQRFSEKLPGLFGSVQQSGTPPKDFDKLRKLLGHWKKSKLFDEGLLSEIEASVFPPAVSVGDKYVPSDVQLGSSAPGTPPQGMTPRATDAASLLSALAQQQKPLAATTAMTLPPVTIPAPTQQPLATTQAAPPADPEQSRLILNHLLGMMGMAPQALGGPGVAQDSIGPGLLSTSTPTVADNPLEFDYDDEDDGLNSKRPTPVMLQVYVFFGVVAWRYIKKRKHSHLHQTTIGYPYVRLLAYASISSTCPSYE